MRIKDIAEKANVSSTTVSNVINENYSKVSAATVDKINELIEKYNYVPKASARNLAAKNTNIIGVLIPWILHKSENPHNALLINTIEQQIRSQGYYMLLSCADTMESAATTLTMWDVDGAIIISYLEENLASVLNASRRNFPIVLIDSYISEEYPQCSCVRLNDYKGGYIAGRYLYSCGHRNIVFAGTSFQTSGVIHQRYKGFCDALKEQGIFLTDNSIINCDTFYENGIHAGKEICNINFNRKPEDRITAVFATSDISAAGIIEGVNLNGISVPKDLSVIGFDNINSCMLTTPKLTTISQDIGQKGEKAASLLIDAIRSGQPSPGLTILEPELIERQSVWRR